MPKPEGWATITQVRKLLGLDKRSLTAAAVRSRVNAKGHTEYDIAHVWTTCGPLIGPRGIEAKLEKFAEQIWAGYEVYLNKARAGEPNEIADKLEQLMRGSLNEAVEEERSRLEAIASAVLGRVAA